MHSPTSSGIHLSPNRSGERGRPAAIKAVASREGNTIKVFIELRAGGYNGSTYTLTLDPVNDVLKGTHFQAVAQQKFEVYFARVKQ